MICHKCRAENMQNSIFCSTCGTKIEIREYKPTNISQKSPLLKVKEKC